ncbi:MAG: PhoH family protein, partial [Acidobacteriota bacterium]
MRKVTVPEAGVTTLFGAYDENLRQLESLLNVRIRTQGHELMVEGDATNTAKVARLVEQLGELITQGHAISNTDV